MQGRTIVTSMAGLAVILMATALQAQEMFNVNLWTIGKPSSSIWTDQGSTDPTDPNHDPDIDTLLLDGVTPAGAPGWTTTQWENIQLAANPFSKKTPATTIHGTSGSTATFEMYNRRNSSPYYWNAVRDDSDVVDIGNATLLDAHASSTEYDNANGTGNPFGYQIADYEVRDIPFAAYDVVFYLGVNDGQKYQGMGTIRINDEVDRPADPTDWGNSVIAQGGLDPSGGIQFTLPTTAQGMEPDGTLDEIEFSGDTGNYIVFTGLTGSTLMVQTWGAGFTHLGIAGFQIRQAQVVTQAGDFNGDAMVEQTDLNLLLANWGASSVPPQWTAPFDGLVDQNELNDLLANWGTGVPGAEPVGATETVAPLVPEPATLGLLVLGGLAACRRRRASVTLF